MDSIEYNPPLKGQLMCTDYRYSAYFHLFLVFYIVIYRAAAAAAAAHCKATGHNISSLAVLTSLALPDLPTTLISTASMTNLRANLALARLVGVLSSVLSGPSAVFRQRISPEERAVATEISDKFFSVLAQRNWENIEVAQDCADVL